MSDEPQKIERKNPDGTVVTVKMWGESWVGPDAALEGWVDLVDSSVAGGCHIPKGTTLARSHLRNCKIHDAGLFIEDCYLDDIEVPADVMVPRHSTIYGPGVLSGPVLTGDEGTSFSFTMYTLNGVPTLRFGCEAMPLANWIGNEEALCKQHSAEFALDYLKRVVATAQIFFGETPTFRKIRKSSQKASLDCEQAARECV